MFIEKLKKEDFANFGKSINAKLLTVEEIETKRADAKLVRVVFDREGYGPNPTFTLQDFECSANSYFQYAEKGVRKAWIRFLFKKFGEEYKIQFKESQMKKFDEYFNTNN